jgi:hypothetical protein
MKSIFLFLSLFSLTAFSDGPALPTHGNGDGDELEYRIRAALLVKMINFFEYPSTALYLKQDQTFRFGILAPFNPFGENLKKYTLEKKTKDRLMEVVQYDSAEMLSTPPDVLYVPASQKYILSQIMGRLAGKPCLIVVEEPCGVDPNGCLGMFVNKQGTIAMDINPIRLESAGISYGPEVLGLVSK